MWQLFQFPLCPFSRKVRLLLGEKGVGYDLVRESPWEGRDEFLDLNPAGTTPVMVDQEKGDTLIDSQEICEYLDRKSTRLNSSHESASPMPSSADKKKHTTTINNT